MARRPAPRDLGAGDATQEAEAGGGAEPGRRVGGVGAAGGRGAAGRAGAARRRAPAPEPPGGAAAAQCPAPLADCLRVYSQRSPGGRRARLLAQPPLTPFELELGASWTSLSEKALLP